MALPGECVNETKTTCYECGTELTIDVLKSAPAIISASSVLRTVRTVVRAVIIGATRRLRKP